MFSPAASHVPVVKEADAKATRCTLRTNVDYSAAEDNVSSNEVTESSPVAELGSITVNSPFWDRTPLFHKGGV